MHRAFLACWFMLAITASVESAAGIVQQCLAAWAKCSISFMFPAVQTYHLLHHRLFFFNASVIHLSYSHSYPNWPWYHLPEEDKQAVEPVDGDYGLAPLQSIHLSASTYWLRYLQVSWPLHSRWFAQQPHPISPGHLLGRVTTQGYWVVTVQETWFYYHWHCNFSIMTIGIWWEHGCVLYSAVRFLRSAVANVHSAVENVHSAVRNIE